MTNIYIISLFSFRNFFSFICILSLLSNIVFSQPLNGTKFIGPTGDYLTITDAINALYANSPNIDGPVVFSIEDGTYNENINITTAITGSNSTNTVTFISKSLNASSVTIAPTSSNIVINIQSSGNLIFQDITFTAPSTGMVALAITAGNITFTGNIFNGSSNIFSPNDQNILLLASLSGGKLNDVTISNNIFNNGYNGIVLGSEDYGDNLNILNNTFSTINSAINLNKFDAPYIKDNLITNSSNTYAISLTDVKNIFFVMNTKISTTTNSGSGILVTNANSTNLARGKVINNFIQAGLKGITLNNTDYVDVMYNSINIENASQTNDLTSAAFEALVLHSNSRINNNIFSNSRSGYTYIGITGTNNVSNYNDLYTTGPLIAKWNSTDQITISDFKTASGSNSFSVEAKPFYTSLTDLHASSPQIANGGTPLVYVFPDIDGQPRDSATPSIGANEFSSTATPLAGTYTIGSSGTFSNISEAVDALYYHGVSNTVEFQILPGSYNEQIDLNGIIPGGSSSSIITFKSQTGDPGDAVINYTSSNETDNFILRIDEAEYVNFKFLGFVAGGTNYSKIVQFENVNGNFEFYKNAFTGYANSTISDKNQAIFHLDDSGTLDNTNISSNNFIGGSYGMYLHLNSSTPGIVISGNTISPVGLGVFLTNANAPIISSNIINTDLFYGITLFNSTNNFVIEKNKIIGHSGISVNQSNGTSSLRGVIKNNFVAAKDNGIALNGATYTDVYFNSVHIDDNSPSISSSAFTMLSGANSQNIIKNNIFYNSIEGYAYNWDSGDLSGSDYNNLFTNGDFIGYYLNDNYKTLVDFITVTNFDDNSVSENLTFVSSTDLHIVGVNPPSPGITISSIADDIDGTVRIGTPTIGAAEFSPSPLNGIYTIGTSGDFQNITSAINYLYLYGINGAVTFNILNGTYNEQLDLDGVISGSSASNTVTFQSNSGNNSTVIITHTAVGTTDNFIVRINLAEYLKFKNLTLTAGGTDFAKVVALENVNGNLEFYGNVMNGFELQSALDSFENQSVVLCNNSGKLNNTIFENNIINYGSYGISLRLNISTPYTQNLQIIGNTIFANRSTINIHYADAPIIKSNILENNYSGNINLNFCYNDFIIEENIISGTSGISIYRGDGTSSNNGLIKNNIISSSKGGISIRDCEYTNVYFNTVRNTETSGSAFTPISVKDGGTDNIRILNNILYASGGCAAINWVEGIITECNYNDLYTTGSTLVTHGSTDYATLAAWQAALEQFDLNSQNEIVTFASSTDLHIVSTPVPLNGIAITGITTDIDGETRGNPPFIGADEPVSEIDLSLTIMLEGSYSTPEMNASLTVPFDSPYTEDPETVNPIPIIIGNEIVDWVLVQLRDENNSSTVLESQSAFVLQDGSVVDLDGVSPVHFTSPSGNYFVSVKHRNHLAVMSASAVGL